jgi:predicted RNA-binding protein Jag
MSDFGAFISLIKKDKSSLTSSDKKMIEVELKKIKENNDYSDCIGEDFLFRIFKIENDNTMLDIVFSEYWHGDNEHEENFEFSKNNDIGQIEEIAEKLKTKLGEVFDIKPKFEGW